MTEIFVFGSNLKGIHGKGAALDAVKHHGAVRGCGEGLQGRSYAIPTKREPYVLLPLQSIAFHVSWFLRFAQENPELKFNITPIGCGLAGYKREQIRPLFDGMPSNCFFASTWNDPDIN